MSQQIPLRSLFSVALALATIAALALAGPTRVRAEDGPPRFGHVFVIVLENEG